MSSIEGMAEQNVILVEKEVSTRFRLLSGLARESGGDEKIIVNKLQGFVETYQFKRIGYIAADGTAETTDGYRLNMSDRDFFQQSMRGKNFLTDAFEDRIDTSHETINVFSVPVYEKERKTVKGVLFATCKDEMLEGCLKNEIFEGQAFNYIIKIDGTIVATSGNSKEWGIGRNIFNTDVSEDERDDYAGDLMLSNMKEGHCSRG